LLKAKADPNAAHVSGGTPLHVASRSKNTVAVAKLVAAGVNVNKKNQYGWTPLHHAVWSADLGIVQKLVAAGAEIESEDNLGRTPLVAAVEYQRKDIAKFLSEQRLKQPVYNN